MQRRFRQALIAIKERGCVGYAKMATIGGFCDLDLIVVKATSPEDLPLQERYVHELIKIFSLSPSSFRAFGLSFARRFSKTHCWPVALKCLILLHRLLRSLPENSPFRAELLCVRSHGLLSLFPCHFQDSSSSFSEDFNLFIKPYAYLLDEALHYCFSIDYDAYQQEEQEKTEEEEEEEEEETEAKAETLTEGGKVNEENHRLLQVLPQLQSLIERLMECRPRGAASRSYLARSAMKLIVRDSFACYTSFRKQFVVLLDNILHMPYRDSLLAFDIYKRAAMQANQLSKFYDLCKSMELCVGWYEYPFVDRVPQIQVQALETFLSGMWQFTGSSSSSSLCSVPSALEPPSSTSSLRGDDDSEEKQGLRKEKIEVSQRREEKPELERGGEMVPLTQMSSTSTLREDDDNEEKQGPRREKTEVCEQMGEKPKLEIGGEMGPLIQFDVEEDCTNGKNVSWETLLEASVNTAHDFFFNPNGYLYGENNLRNGRCKAEPPRADGWEMQIFDSQPNALNPFYHQYATNATYT